MNEGMEYLESRTSRLKASHVYISFKGDEETGKFVHGLSAALKAKGMRIFGNDKKHETRDSTLPSHLRQAIGQSWVWIVVFSKSYASSCWCLQELALLVRLIVPSDKNKYYKDKGMAKDKDMVKAKAKAMDKDKDKGDPSSFFYGEQEMYEADIHKVKRWKRDLKYGPGLSKQRDVVDRTIAIYYDVDPNSFAQHIEQAYARDLIDLTLRKEDIKQVMTTLSACRQLHDYSSGPQIIPKIVKQVKTKTDQHLYDYFGFVGIQTQVEEVEKLLCLSRDDEVGVVGICGMSGLGKSTIATVLYLKIFHCFDAFCFLPNVSARLKQGDVSLQQLLYRHLETENLELMDFLDEGFLSCKILRNQKLLLVLDGVDLVQHLQELNLVEISNTFGWGTRIIITTRDDQVLQEYEVDTVYRPKLLSEDEAFNLFCSKAFPKEYPISDFKDMIYKALEYASGLPLAIELLGSSFFGKGIAEWRSFLDREEIIPPYEITRVLRKSLDELDDMSKKIFLDIACFFVGKDTNYVKEILHDCKRGDVDMKFKLLIQKSLITTANQRIQMHGMLQAMGREIVRQQCPNQPELRCRLYLFSDVKQVMERKRKEIQNVKAIALDLDEPKGVMLSIEALSHMANLRLLIFRNVEFTGTLDNLSSKLRYISWHQYPFTSLPSSFKSDRLVQLIMPESNMTKLWKGKMMLPKLRKINLCGSKSLTKMPDFGGVPKLERLELEGCTGLLKLDPSIAKLSKLKLLNLRGCMNLVSIPNSLFSHNSLEILILAGCSKLAYCLEFSPMKSMIQVKLLSVWDSSPLKKLLYFLLLVLLPEQKSYHDFACCCLIYLMCFCEVNHV